MQRQRFKTQQCIFEGHILRIKHSNRRVLHRMSQDFNPEESQQIWGNFIREPKIQTFTTEVLVSLTALLTNDIHHLL